jgi:hypothetical protein
VLDAQSLKQAQQLMFCTLCTKSLNLFKAAETTAWFTLTFDEKLEDNFLVTAM